MVFIKIKKNIRKRYFLIKVDARVRHEIVKKEIESL